MSKGFRPFSVTDRCALIFVETALHSRGSPNELQKYDTDIKLPEAIYRTGPSRHFLYHSDVGHT